MNRAAHIAGCCLAVLVGLGARPLSGSAQEKPLSLTGELTTGYYTTATENGQQGRASTTPLLLNFDLNGYIGRPDFISYRLRPQLSLGAQASDAGFLGGNGLTLTTTFLSRRSFPLTLTYTNLERELLTYGTVNRVSGLRSTSHRRDFGLNWQLRFPHWPQVRFDLNRSRDTLAPDDPIIPDFESRSRQYRLAIDDHHWGWNFNGNLRWENSSSDFANPLEPEVITVALHRDTTRYDFTAQRPLWRRSQVILSGGVLQSQDTFNDRPFDQDARYFNGLFSFAWGERWQGSYRTGYSSNVLGTQIQEALSQVGPGGGTGPIASENLIFVPFETQVSTLSHAGTLRYQAHPDWNFLGTLSQSSVSTRDGRIATPDTDFLNGTGGVDFHRSFSWATVTSNYTLSVGRMTFADIPDSRLLGQTFTFLAQRGSLERLELTGSLTLSAQRVEQTIPLRTRSEAVQVSLGRRWGSWIVRGGLGIQGSSFRDGGLDYDANGLSFRASADHQRVQVQYFRNSVDGNALQPFAGNAATSSGASALLLGIPLRTIVSSTRTQTLHVRAFPWRRLETDFRWIAGRQQFDGQVSNDYDNLDFSAGYRFRLLTFAVGYTHYGQSFLTIPEYRRSRLYFRISRPFRVF